MAPKYSSDTPPLFCGLIMPISGIDGCTSEHWTHVREIITDSIEAIPDLRFQVKLVSDADDVGVIHERIVQNVHSADIVICDVSGKNPNVMFELGMRLAFDKPTIIIKDDRTAYSFDTGILEHLIYPRDLHFKRMMDFKALLAKKVVATHEAASTGRNHSTFLKSFGTFQVASDRPVIHLLSGIQTELQCLRQAITSTSVRSISPNELVKRLAEGSHPVEVGLHTERTMSRFQEMLRRGHVFIKFTQTRGGTEFGVPLNRSHSDLTQADFLAGTGMVRICGELTLDYVPVRVVAEIDLPSLRGRGYLEILNEQRAA